MQISIIIPTYNEEENIQPMLERIAHAMSQALIEYEVIFVDDHSQDNTKEMIINQLPYYPVKFFDKIGGKGKAQSLLEGFSHARYENIAMIDADLQYAPEIIPDMLNKLKKTDIVIAHRKIQQTSFIRKFTSRSFMYIFGKLLHGLSYDIQSGLKVFKKEILDHISLHPTQWSFDLEFLAKAKEAGYTISEYNTTFYPRTFGKSHVRILRSSYEIGLAALKLKMEKPAILTRRHHHGSLDKGFSYKGNKYVTYTHLPMGNSAFFRFTQSQKSALLLLAVIFILSLIFSWRTTVLVTVSSLTFLYFTDLFFNLYIILKSFQVKKTHAHQVFDNSLPENNLPTYTIFCPLYNEWEMLPDFAKAMQKLDYPKDKLQVLLLLEENDKKTIEKAGLMQLPEYFQIIVVPHSLPKTKPKACNYGLQFATGEYAVIYDAEDTPEPDQLKKSVQTFQESPANIACVQAKLNFYNPHQNLLTKLFTTEYSLWFDLILMGLQKIGAPIPLGGTSNHFRTKLLREFHGWDSFNVTEDCDLGIRLAKQGYKTAVIDSTTYEEANSDVLNWFNQRSRWIKGYIQTYFVHIRDLKQLSDQSYWQLFMFHFIVGGKILSMFINPFMWITCIIYFAFRAALGPLIESFFPTPVLYMAVTSIIFGNFLYLYYYMLAAARRGFYNLIIMGFLVPVYWLMMSVAAWKAVWELIFNPHYWAKTKHGLHLPKVIEKTKISIPYLGFQPNY